MKREPSTWLLCSLGLLLLVFGPFSSVSAQNAPEFHIYAPGKRLGPPSAPTKQQGSGRMDWFAEILGEAGELRSHNTFSGWYHVSSLNYTLWFRMPSVTFDKEEPSSERGSPDIIISPTKLSWYNVGGARGGSASLNRRNQTCVVYQCSDENGDSFICLMEPEKDVKELTKIKKWNPTSSVFNPVLDAHKLRYVGAVDSFELSETSRGWGSPSGWLELLHDGGVTHTERSGERASPRKWGINVAAQDRQKRASIVMFSTEDESFQYGYEYDRIIYSDGNFSVFEAPDFLFLDDSSETEMIFLKLTMMEGKRDYIVYGSMRSGVFVEDASRPPSLIDFGLFSHSKSFLDPVTQMVILVGHLFEPEGVEVADLSHRKPSWEGALSLPRAVSYDKETKRLRFSPHPELKALRHTKLFDSKGSPLLIEGEANADGMVVVPLTLYESNGGLLEVTVQFELVSQPEGEEADHGSLVTDLAEELEVGLLIGPSHTSLNNTRMGLRFPTEGSCRAAGKAGKGLLFRTIPLFDAFNENDTARCEEACRLYPLCDRWDAVLRPFGMNCKLYTLSASSSGSGEVCGTRSGCPLEFPLLFFQEGSSSGTSLESTSQGRAPFHPEHSNSFELHVFIDHSIIEVFKDGGLETVSGRMVADSEEEVSHSISLFTKNLPSGLTVKAHALSVYALGSIWAPAEADMFRSEKLRAVDNFTKSFGGLFP